MPDTFEASRMTFQERIARLVGRSGWREPVEGTGTRTDRLPDEHAVATALSFARNSKNPRDIGPDIAYCIICQSPAYRRQVVRELAAALFSECGRVGQRNRDMLPVVAGWAFDAVVHGTRKPGRPVGTTRFAWEALTSVAEAVLLRQADEAINEAERRYRA